MKKNEEDYTFVLFGMLIGIIISVLFLPLLILMDTSKSPYVKVEPIELEGKKIVYSYKENGYMYIETEDGEQFRVSGYKGFNLDKFKK